MGRDEPITDPDRRRHPEISQEQQQQQHHRLNFADLLAQTEGGDADALAAAVARVAGVARGRPASRLHHVQIQDEKLFNHCLSVEAIQQLRRPAHDAVAEQRVVLQQEQQQQELH